MRHIQKLIEVHRISKVYLARRMKMPYGTFTNKLNAKQSIYRFSQDEEHRLNIILRDLAEVILKNVKQ